MSALIRITFWLILLGIIAAGSAIGYAYHWVHKPLALSQPTIDVRVPAGASPTRIAHLLVNHGVQIPAQSFVWLARLTELDREIKAGGYQVSEGDSLWDVLNRMARGEVSHRQVALIEGWTVHQIMQTLARHPDVEQTLVISSMHEQAQLAKQLGLDVSHVEGLLYPDTYVFPVGTRDEEILKRAIASQNSLLEELWQNRAPDLPLNSPYEALILASIIEKETGRADERARIAGVFVNRLRVKMPLQTDPTVIYGMGERYDGRIRKADLQRDTPWNTYTRGGLPPTPIASPGRASIEAALNPETHNYFYFVARGDGSSAFAQNLADHNRNVVKYILRRP
jgi:UPF0755 protein